MTDTPGDRRVRELFGELQPQLARMLASNLHVPEWIVDEACQSAWGSLVENGDAVASGRELGWLSTTATRVALQLWRREHLVDVRSDAGDGVLRVPQPSPERSLELRERLAEVRQLPLREQRVVMLHGFGYEYEEIAAVTGDTRRTVARQLMRARQRLRVVE